MSAHPSGMRPSNGYETPTDEAIPVAMRGTLSKASVCLVILTLLALPALGMSNGPGALNGNEESTVKYGCSCHNNGAPSDRVIVMITGVPVMYDLDASYPFTITVADSLTLSGGDGNNRAGFLLSSEGVGVFSWSDDQELRQAEDAPDDVSHSEPDLDGVWQLTWTSPSEDAGQVNFWLAGNSVDGGGLPDETDYWNLLSFSINPPGTIVSGDDAATLETRTISVGDYDTLFVIDESESQKEAERQAALALSIYQQGNALYWTSLVALLVGAVAQREVLERRYGDGPEYLAMELAYPQAIRRGLLSIASFLIGVRWMSSDTAISFPPSSIVHEGTRTTDLTGFLIGCAFFLSAWAAYGVYRTILATRVEREVKDIL
ncbi:MAG: choice-of-anchor V domain-containing protein [Candidatus Thalassarchaeum sp.]